MGRCLKQSMDLLRFNSASINLLTLLLDWAAESISKCVYFEELQTKLIQDEVLNVYVESSIPVSLAQDDEGALQVRAVSLTVITGSGTDDPADVAWPIPGTSYAGAGDLDELGGSNVTAVVGATHDLAGLLLRAEGRYRVNNAIVTLTKTATTVLDPFGGSTLVPGAVVSYRIDVDVAGGRRGGKPGHNRHHPHRTRISDRHHSGVGVACRGGSR